MDYQAFISTQLKLGAHQSDIWPHMVMRVGQSEAERLLPRPWPEKSQQTIQHQVIKNYGPGTELKKLLQKIGAKMSETCSCNARMQQMNDWGIEACKQNKSVIVNWLKEETLNIEMVIKTITTGLILIIDLADPYGSIVNEAIRRAK